MAAGLVGESALHAGVGGRQRSAERRAGLAYIALRGLKYPKVDVAAALSRPGTSPMRAQQPLRQERIA